MHKASDSISDIDNSVPSVQLEDPVLKINVFLYTLLLPWLLPFSFPEYVCLCLFV